ncbi:DNA polymerase III subunit psi [Orbaceae bacterium ESL0727]|nr:DNA polymerase III subunit psi [Orbaceae bacterium ESL0727]
MTQLDWYLTQCGITQYILRKLSALRGEVISQIGEDIRLIVVANHQPTEKIYFDILSAIHITTEQVFYLAPSQLIFPADAIKKVIWFIDQRLPDQWQNPLTIQTSNLQQLANSPHEKRQLWQQLCQYEAYFS